MNDNEKQKYSRLALTFAPVLTNTAAISALSQLFERTQSFSQIPSDGDHVTKTAAIPCRSIVPELEDNLSLVVTVRAFLTRAKSDVDFTSQTAALQLLRVGTGIQATECLPCDKNSMLLAIPGTEFSLGFEIETALRKLSFPDNRNYLVLSDELARTRSTIARAFEANSDAAKACYFDTVALVAPGLATLAAAGALRQLAGLTANFTRFHSADVQAKKHLSCRDIDARLTDGQEISVTVQASILQFQDEFVDGLCREFDPLEILKSVEATVSRAVLQARYKSLWLPAVARKTLLFVLDDTECVLQLKVTTTLNWEY